MVRNNTYGIIDNLTTATEIRVLWNLFAMHELPECVISNNGTSFTSEEFQSFLKNNGIQHVLTQPYHPASNGMTEQGVQTAKNALRRMNDQLRKRCQTNGNTLEEGGQHTWTQVLTGNMLYSAPQQAVGKMLPAPAVMGGDNEEGPFYGFTTGQGGSNSPGIIGGHPKTHQSGVSNCYIIEPTSEVSFTQSSAVQSQAKGSPAPGPTEYLQRSAEPQRSQRHRTAFNRKYKDFVQNIVHIVT
ncbi:hypothetical protein PR048_006391 [Dryococelus australis]|uniref:Integrase catalytic domain-containing protein n=1 Tax=Dryococelus australis TaxID=614101 RepID=A0ABQ9IAU4_9NEOP|nr:hypothetical protein PR048_006391 [Dryococelus australis]